MDSKTIIITGASKGIGRALVEYFLNRNFNVIGCSRSKPNISAKGFTFYSVDLADFESIDLFWSNVRQGKHDNIYALINCAGLASMNHSLFASEAVINNLFDVNFKASFRMSQMFAKVLLSKKRPGRIIHFSTVAVPLKLEGELIYAASKNAVEMMSSVLAKELGSFGITSNVIGPTPIATDLIKAVPKNKIKDLISVQAIARMGRMEDIFNVIEFYLDEKSEFITGQKVYLGGVS